MIPVGSWLVTYNLQIAYWIGSTAVNKTGLVIGFAQFGCTGLEYLAFQKFDPTQTAFT